MAKIVKPTAQSINEAVEILERGGIIIYPTESSYAIGCDATNDDAAKKIYEIKGRDQEKKLPMIVGDRDTARKYGKLDIFSEKLCIKFMPGPLTIIIPKKWGVSDLVNTDFVFRISENKVAREIARLLKRPIVSTSANLSGEKPIYSSEEVIKQFSEKVDLIIDAGDLEEKPASTIVKDGKVIREGAISGDKISLVLCSP